MNLLKTSVLNGFGVLSKLVSALVLNKLLAVYVGPAGYAVIGQYQSFLAIVNALAGGSFSNGIIALTAERQDHPEHQRALWHTAFRLSLYSGLVLAALLLVFRHEIISSILKDQGDSSLVFWMAACLIPTAFNMIFLALLNGKRLIGWMVLSNIGANAVAIAVTWPMAHWFGLQGVLVALSFTQALACALTFSVIWKSADIRFKDLLGRIEKSSVSRLVPHALMALTTALAVPAAQLATRNFLISDLGLDRTGIWQALVRMSDLHTMLLSTILSAYFLPKFASLKTRAEIKSELKASYKFIIPAAVASAAIIYGLRGFLTQKLFSSEFLEVAELLGLQVIGDVIRLVSIIPGYVLIGRSHLRPFVVSELFAALALFLLTVAGARLHGLPGTCYAYILLYAFYGILMLVLLSRAVRTMPETQRP